MNEKSAIKVEFSKMLTSAERAINSSDFPRAWQFLTDAHILSQPFAYLHLQAHWRMLALALKTRDCSEALGQVLRLLVAAPGSLLKIYPVGNSGRSSASMFAPMQFPAHLQAVLGDQSPVRRSNFLKLTCVGFSFVILLLGFISFGFLTTMVFASGFIGGLVLWLLVHSRIPYARIKAPFWLAFFFFVVHRVEEKLTGFFAALSEITQVPTPEIASWNIILLVLLSVGSWLSIPWLLKKQKEFGYYLLWTFFAAMGITELAHLLVFPFLVDKPYGYFPGMASVPPLAASAWWGMWRLFKEVK